MGNTQTVSGWFQPSPVPDVATGQTVSLMCTGIDRSAKDPKVQAAARDAIARFGNDPFRTGGNADLARAVWWWCKYSVKKLPHQEFKAIVSAFPEKKQLIIDPSALLSMAKWIGDCSTFTMLVCSLLKCLGVPYDLVTVAVDPREPQLYTHVYPEAILEDGARLPLDASHGPYPGWQVPSSDVFRYQCWDSEGNPVPSPRAAPSRLQAYIRRVGLGQTDTDTDLSDVTTDLSGPTTDLSGPTTEWYGPMNTVSSAAPASTPLPAVSAPASTATSPIETGLINLANAWTQIGSKVIAPTTTYTVGKNGQITYSTPAGTASTLPAALSSLGSSGSLIMLLALGVGAFILVKSLGNR
jgi:hypothetical protein